MKSPYILLSTKCEIIDLSDEIRSCPGKALDRALLLCSMSESDAERLVDFCATPPAPAGSDIANTRCFRLKLHSYRYGIVERSPRHSEAVALRLFTEEKDMEASLSDSTFELLTLLKSGELGYAFEAFSAKGKFIDAREIGSLIEKALPHADALCRSTLTYTCVPTSADGSGGCFMPIDLHHFLLSLTSVVTVLDSISVSGEISISTCHRGDSFEVIFGTSSDVVPFGTVGSLDHVLSLAPFISGSYTDLSLACYGAERCGMSISTSCSADGAIKFILSSISELLPPLEFKTADPEHVTEAVFKDVLRAISSVKEKEQ